MEVTKQSRRSIGSRLFHSKNDKEEITGWRQDLNGILQIFNVCVLLFTFNCFSLPLPD